MAGEGAAEEKRPGGRRALLRALRLIPGPVYRRLKGNPLLRRILDRVMPRGRFAVTRIRGGPLKGMVFELDPRTNKDMALGRYEPHVVDRIGELVSPGATAFDVGAHLGYETMVMARLAGQNGRVVCFEPDRDLATRLRANIERNRSGVAADVVPVEAALAATSGKVGFERGLTTGTGKLAPQSEGEQVDTLSLDDAASRHGSPAFVKIDVEGFELEALAGAGELLEKKESSFLVEAHSPELAKACVEVFEAAGYACERIGEADAGGAHIVAIPRE